MDSYQFIKTLHIISSAVLFGTGLGTAFFFFCANRQNNLAARFFAARTTVAADFLFTLPAVIFQPLTGFWLVSQSGYHLTEGWLIATYILYVIAGLCWVPVVFIQIRLKKILKKSLASNKALPVSYARLLRLWFLLGWPAFGGLIAIYFLMVLKPA